MPMLYVLHSHGGVDLGPKRAFGRPAKYCGIKLRTRYLDDKLRGTHGKDSRVDGTSAYRSP